MIEIFLDFLIFLFGKKSYKRIKKWFSEPIKKKKEASKKPRKEKNRIYGQTFSACTGCNQIPKEPPVYEQGKPWCHKCYKTQILKLR